MRISVCLSILAMLLAGCTHTSGDAYLASAVETSSQPANNNQIKNLLAEQRRVSMELAGIRRALSRSQSQPRPADDLAGLAESLARTAKRLEEAATQNASAPRPPAADSASYREELAGLRAALEQHAAGSAAQLAELKLAVETRASQSHAPAESEPVRASPAVMRRLLELDRSVAHQREATARIGEQSQSILEALTGLDSALKRVETRMVSVAPGGSGPAGSLQTAYVACRKKCLGDNRGNQFECTQECTCEAQCRAFGTETACSTYCRSN